MKKIWVAVFALIFASFLNVNAAECTENCVAKIGDTKYSTIMDAINAVPGDGQEVVIDVLRDSDTEVGIMVKQNLNKNFVVNLNNHTVQFSIPLVGSTGTESQNIHIEKGNTATFKNGTLKTDPSARMFIQNYCDLTLEDVTIDTTNAPYKELYSVSNNNGTVKIIGNTNIYSNAYAFDMCWAPNKGYPNGTQITVDTTGTIKGVIQLDVWGKFTTPIKSTLTILNMNHEGTFDIDERLASQLEIKGGTYSEAVDVNLLPETSVAVEDDGKYVIQPNKTYAEEEMGVYFESEEALNHDYELEITEIEKDNLPNIAELIKLEEKFNKEKDATILSLYDLTMYNENSIVELTGKFTITLPFDKTQKFDTYKVIYINEDGEIVEVIDPTIEDNKIVFETTHLSAYGVVGYNNPPSQRVTDNNSNNPKTADKIMLYVLLAVLSASTGYLVFKKTKKRI
ncbi:MAG: hypothetical protein IJI22_02735 [Bacilli bacterium]|nr:hypothetical protein [Bacilli bacterium]